MSSDYRIALNWNIALASLVKFAPQPRSPGVQPTVRNYLATPDYVDQGLYIELAWNILQNGVMYRSVLNQAGLQSNRAAKVTVYARDDLFNYVRYNGVAIRPEPKWDNYYPRDLVILIRDLVLST